MKLFAIGDLHLGFSVEKTMELFGEKWINHAEKIEKEWLKVVSKNDVVLIPGDISWAMRLDEAHSDLLFLEKLPGQKVCIRGNHDYWWDRPGKLNKAYMNLYFLQNKAYLIDHLAICGTRGWTTPNPNSFTEEDQRLLERELKRLRLSLEDGMRQGAKEIWVLLHYPPTYNQVLESPIITLLKQYPVTRVIYGHLHDELSWEMNLQGDIENINYKLVSADYLEFKPLYLEDR